MLRFLYNLHVKINRIKYKTYIKLRYPNFFIGPKLTIYGKWLFSIHPESEIRFGSNIIFRSDTKYNFVGINKPVSIAVRKNAVLHIGDNSGFSGTSIFVSKKIIIGKNCNFGGNTSIWDTDFHPLDFQARRINDNTKINSASIYIGDDVFIGANTIILKGVKVGDRVIIGAGSVVAKSIPSDEIWAGNPAKFIRKTNYFS
jgi:acetyltransferase-like isoleucine patch superfamily enzyme